MTMKPCRESIELREQIYQKCSEQTFIEIREKLLFVLFYSDEAELNAAVNGSFGDGGAGPFVKRLRLFSPALKENSLSNSTLIISAGKRSKSFKTFVSRGYSMNFLQKFLNSLSLDELHDVDAAVKKRLELFERDPILCPEEIAMIHAHSWINAVKHVRGRVNLTLGQAKMIVEKYMLNHFELTAEERVALATMHRVDVEDMVRHRINVGVEFASKLIDKHS